MDALTCTRFRVFVRVQTVIVQKDVIFLQISDSLDLGVCEIAQVRACICKDAQICTGQKT